MTTIGNRIVLARKNLGILQETFAQFLDITQEQVENIEQNKKQPEVDLLVKIAKTLNVDLQWLITGEMDNALKRPAGNLSSSKINQKLFQESVTVILTLVEKYKLKYTPEEIAKISTTLYKFSLKEKSEDKREKFIQDKILKGVSEQIDQIAKKAKTTKKPEKKR